MPSFAGLEFIFRFLPIFLLIYYVIPDKYKDMVLLLGSLFFYAMGEPVFLPVFLLLIWVNYLFGKKSSTYTELYEVLPWQKKEQKKIMVAAVVMNVVVLALFKGLCSFVDNSLLPIGISFYIFKMISFQADIYRGEIKEELSFKKTALYFSLFLQVVSGPIMRYGEGNFSEQRTHTLEKVEEGLFFFVTGLGMKVLLADRLAILWNELQTIGFQSISTPLAWFGAFSYSMQLYFDFWGYSLMASGIMVMLGFSFIENFNHPYAARTIGEFYRRWHMTLGSFFRDYVYFPMGGSRCNRIKMVRNLAFVWLLTGIWHGNGLNFVIWGVVLGIFIILEKLLYGKIFSKVPILGNLYVLFLIPITWVIFAISDLAQLGIYLGRMFPMIGGAGIAVNQQDIVKYAGMYGGLFCIGVVLCIPFVYRFFEKHRKNVFVVLLMTVVFWMSVYFLATSAGNPFMYFKF